MATSRACMIRACEMLEYHSRVNAKDRPVLMRYVHVHSCKNLIKALRYTGAASRPRHVFTRAEVKRIKKKSAPAFRQTATARGRGLWLLVVVAETARR